MNLRNRRRRVGLGSALVAAALMLFPTLWMGGCASAKRNPDERPGLRRRADESQRDFERTIEKNRKDHRENH